MNMIKVGKWFIRVLLLLVFIYLLATSFSWHEFLSVGSHFFTNPKILAFVFLSYLGSFFLKALAWKLYFRGQIPLSSSIYGIFYSLFINHLLPFKVGDVVRAMVLYSRERKVTLEEAFHSVFILRVMDITGLGILVGLGSLFLTKVFSFPIYLFLFFIAFGLLSFFVIKKKFPSFFHRNVKLFFEAFSGWNGVLIFLFVLCSWLLEGAVLLGVAIILKESITPIEAIWANSLTIMGQTFQFTPGGLTTYEAVMTYALTMVHISAKQGMIIAIYSHAFKFLFSYLIGIYVYIKYPITIHKLKEWLKMKGVKQQQHEKRI